MSNAGYSDKGDQYYANASPEMPPFVPAQARTLLEVWCGGADFAALLRSQRDIHVTAIEAFAAAAKAAAARVDRLLAGSLEDSLRELAGQRFDCIVINGVLEHLVDPWAALGGLAAVLAPGGVPVASIPNARYLPGLKEYVLEGQWRYRRDEVMDQTHLQFFTARSLHDLFGSSGYKLVQQTGINETPFAWKFGLLNRLTRGALDDARFLQFACVAALR